MLARELADIVGASHVLADPALKAGYEQDLTGRYHGEALLVVRPASREEVAAVLACCARAGAAVVPQGGQTGLVGGGTPRNGEVVLSLRRLGAIEEPDLHTGQVTVGAGTTLAALQEHARARGLELGVDLAARGSATIGGMTATNAGGAYAVRHGTMRAQVAGLEAVLVDGRVVDSLRGLLKDNAGLDLTGLLVGSEGTLAVITRVRLRLVPVQPHRVTAVLGLPGLDAALGVLEALRRGAPSLEAADYFHAHGLQRVRERHGLPPLLAGPHDTYLVVELAGQASPEDELECVADLVEDAAVAADPAGRERLWAYRELHNETVASLGVPHKLDVSVAVSSLPAFERDVTAEVERVAPGAEVILYGHLGDGNVHVNVIGPSPGDESVDEAVLELVARHGGSISAEHGIGLAKSRWLHLSRSQAEISLMRDLKRVFDPAGVLNPDRLLGRR